ncbi:MAG: hypothetical protein NT062_34475 [Proteobacteria bacterium]|nr:hypothetical protein [Pseudomonadota bacterium]
MGTNILTKTERQMEDRMADIGNDPVRADTLAKARAFKRTWIELAEALARVTQSNAWQAWGYPAFDDYCRKELHLKQATVAKLLNNYHFLESAAPRVIERARDQQEAPVPSMATIDFVQKATERAAADKDTMDAIHRVAFEEGADATSLRKQYGELAFPVSTREKKDKLRGAIAMTARKLTALLAENDSPVPKKIAVRIEEAIGEMLESIEN